MISISVCDDNIDELTNMARLINQYRIDKHLDCEYTVFQNGFELISVLEKGRSFNLYCLDIIMPAFTGIDVAKEIRRFDKIAPIIFFTSSSEFALQSYSVNAINYVLKPISKEKLFLAIDSAIDHMKLEHDDSIVVNSADGIQRILLSNLVYVEVIGRNVFYHLYSGRVIKCIDSFVSVSETLLKHNCFIKTHRSYIVNMRYTDTIGNNKMTLQTLSSIPIAQGKTREIKERYLAFQMEDE